MVYVLSIFFAAFIAPSQTLAALIQKTLTITTQADFEEGATSNTVIEGGENGEVKLEGDADGDWWDTSWKKRKPITISNSGSLLTDYQLELEIPYEVEMKSSFDDIRFTNGSSQILNYWIKSKTDESQATVWVKIDVLAAETDTHIHMYYNNPESESESSIEDTFVREIDGLVGSWHMDEGSGSTTYDSSGNNSGGQIFGATWADGKFEKSLRFNGVNDYTIINDNFVSNPTGLTMSGWFRKMGEGSNYECVLHKGSSNTIGATDYWMGVDLNDNITATIGANTGVGWAAGQTSIKSLLNTWYYVVATWDGSVVRVYVDGSFIKQYALSSYGNLSAPTRFGASANGTQYQFNGNVDDIFIYNRALTADEVFDSYTNRGYTTTDYPGRNLVRKHSDNEITHAFGSAQSALPPLGTWTSAQSSEEALNLIWNGGWGAPNGFEADVNISPNTSISFEIRSSDVAGIDANWSSWQGLGAINSGGGTGDRNFQIPEASMPGQENLPIGTNKYIQLRATLTTSDGLYTPALKEIRLIYLADESAPTNPNSVVAYKDNTKQDSVTNAGWSNSATPYFEWSGAEDGFDESGVKGYWVYFGTDETADPKTAGAWQTGTSYQGNIEEANSGKTFYLAISTEDYAENRYLNGLPTYFKEFTYKFDRTPPTNPSNVSVQPFGWSTVNDFNFNWNSGSDPMLNGDASGVLGYQYRIGDNGEWSVTIPNLQLNNVQAYQNGENAFYLRTVDNAGNLSSPPVKITYRYNADAPEAPQNLSVTPQSSQENRFSFNWELPANFNGTIKKYYYSVNSLPSEQNAVSFNVNNPPNNVTIDGNGKVTLSDISAASQQGLNTFYVAAMDDTENINFNNYTQVQFECNTPAPGFPVGVDVFDTSNRDLQKYSVALSWEAPEFAGVGFAGYIIERSDDNSAWTEVGSGTSNSYIDVGLESRPYFYRVKSKDNSNNVSAPSTVVSITPTGKYTSPPELTDGPTIEYKISSAKVSWLTDRESSSFVEIGENANYGLTQGQFDFTKKHEVNLDNLKPDTIYHYRVKYVDQDGNIGYSGDATFKTEPAPRAANVKIYDIRLDSAVITWNTTARAECSVLIGKGSNYSTTIENVSGGFTTAHSVRLSELDHSSKYHFAVKIKDIDGNEVISDDYTFETLKFPKVSLVRMEPVKGVATATMKFTWETNVPTSSIVEYTPEGGRTQEAVSSKLATNHEIVVKSLLDNSFYSIRIQGRDQFGNLAISDTQRFKTDYDTRPPEISKITSESEIVGFGTEAKGQIIVSWETDEPATSQVEYGIGSTGDYTNRTQEDTSLTMSHVVIVSELKTSSPYHFRIVSRDESRNEGYSDNYSVLTGQASDSVFDIILQTLIASLGWLIKL